MRTKVGWVARLLGRLGRRFWVMRIDRVLSRAYEAGVISSQLLHELDDRLKRTGNVDWYRNGEGPIAWPWTGGPKPPPTRENPFFKGYREVSKP